MKCTVSLIESEEETVEGALYYQFEEGWVIFKDDEGKAVVAYPEKRVTRIKRIDETAEHGDLASQVARRITEN